MSNIFEQDRKLSCTYFCTKMLLSQTKKSSCIKFNLAINTKNFKIKLIKTPIWLVVEFFCASQFDPQLFDNLLNSFSDAIDVYEYTGDAGQSNFQIFAADLPSNYIIPLDHVNIRLGLVLRKHGLYRPTPDMRHMPHVRPSGPVRR